MEEKQLEFVRSLYNKYGITDEEKINYANQAFKDDFDGTLSAFYSKYNPQKEINKEYFDGIKNSYYLTEPDIAPVQVAQEEAPSGFWANLRNHLDNVPEKVANSFWMGLNMVDRNIDNVFDVTIEKLTGTPQSGESANTEFFMDRVNSNNQDILPTKGILDKGATIPERASGVAGAAIDFARSIVSGAVSYGTIPMVEQAESMYLDAVEEKAKAAGKNPLQLIIDNEDDELEPLLYGAAAAALEKIGLKGVEKYIKSVDSSVFKWLYSNAKEASTEWGQGMLEFINQERAKGRGVPEALTEAFNRGLSREGAETFVSGFTGAAGIGAAGRGIRKLVSKDSTEETDDQDVDVDQEAEDETAERMALAAAAQSAVDTGDQDVDQIVQNALRETEQSLKSKILSEKQEEEKRAAEKQKIKDEKAAKSEEEKQNKQKEKAQEVVDSTVAKEVSRVVKDKESLKNAMYQFTGSDKSNKDDVDKINAYANFLDGIAGARAKREGVSKEEWYRSRISSIGTTGDPASATGTTFLEDGKAIIRSLNKGDMRSFFNEFSKVIQRDLNDAESSALTAEFGIDFKNDLSEDSFKTFSSALESYMQTGVVPSGIKGNNAVFIKAAFEKISNWLRDIKSSIEGESSLYVNRKIRGIFDSIVTATDIAKQDDVLTQKIDNADTTTEGKTNINESSNIETKLPDTTASNKVGETGEGERIEDFSEFEGKTSDEIYEMKYRADESVDTAARNLRSTDPRDDKEYAEAKKGFDDAVDYRNKFDRYKERQENLRDLSVLIEDEKDKFDSEGDRYEYSEEYNKDPRLAAIARANDMVEFARLNRESGINEDAYLKDIRILEKDIKENPIKEVEKVEDNKKVEKKPKKNEQTAKKKSDEGVLPVSKGQRTKPQADATKRRTDAFSKASKDFKVKPSGRINGGDANIKSAIDGLNKLSQDQEQTLAVRSDAAREAERLSEILNKANENRALIEEKAKKMESIKEAAKNDGYTSTGVRSFFGKVSNIPIEYDNGSISYFDMETGETGEYVLSENKSRKISAEEFKEQSKERKKREGERRASREEERIKSEEEERAEREAKEAISKKDKESSKVNDAHFITEDKDPSAKSIESIIDKLDSVDFDVLSDKSVESDEGDISVKQMGSAITSFFKDYLSEITSAKNQKELQKNTVEYNKIKDKLKRFVKDTPFLTEKQRDELVGLINSSDISIADLESRIKSSQEKKTINDKIGGTRGTVLDKTRDVVVQTEFFEESIGEKLSGMFKDLMRGFGIKSKLITFDASIFFNKNHKLLKGKTNEEINEIRENAINRLAGFASSTKTRTTNQEYKNVSFESNRNTIIKAINEIISGDSNGFIINGSDFSIIAVNTFDKNYIRTATHEFGHFIELQLLDQASDETKRAIEEEWKKWLSSRNMSGFKTPTNFDSDVADGDFFSYYTERFREYFAEQVSYWINTNEKPSSIVEKFFNEVAKAIKKLFLSYKETYGVSESITKFLNDQFSLDGDRATEQQKKSREFALDSAAKSYSSIVSNTNKMADIEAQLGVKASIPAGVDQENVKEIMKNFFAKKKELKESLRKLEEKNETSKKNIEDQYENYVKSGGTMDFNTFSKKALEKGEEMLAMSIERMINSNVYQGDPDSPSGEAGDGMPMVDFQKTNKNPRSGSKRDILLDKLAAALDGKFNDRKTFNDLIRTVNKSLKAAGEPIITKKEKDTILGKTKSGSIAKITTPIYELIYREGKRTKELLDIIKSFSASRQERDDALAKADLMIKSGKPLTEDEMYEFHKLQLVGLFNTTMNEREQLLKDKVGNGIVDVEKSRISQRVLERRNEDRKIVADAFYSSVIGLEKISDGVYDTGKKDASGNKITISVYDRSKSYPKGALVEYQGSLYTVTEPIGKYEKGFRESLKKEQDINIHRTNAELNKKSNIDRFLDRMNRLFLNTHGIESLANILKSNSADAAFDGALSNMLGIDGFRRAARNKRNHHYKVEEMYKTIAEKIFNVKGLTAVNKKLYDIKTDIRTIKFKDESGNDVSIKMTAGEMMTWYAYMGQPDLVAKFENMNKNWSHNPKDSRYWSKEKAQSIIDSMTKEEKDFVDGVVKDIMPYVYDTLNKSHRRELGYDMQIIEHYFPTRVEVEETDARNDSSAIPTSQNFTDFVSSISNKNTKERRSNTPLKAGDFMAQFLQYSDRAFHYAEYVGPMKRASLLFQNSKYDYSGYIRTKFGDSIMKQIKINLDNIAYGAPSRRNQSYLLDMIRSLGISGAFMANPTMLFKQAASFVAMADGMGWRDFMKYFVTRGPEGILKDLKKIKEMGFVKERLSQGGKNSYDTYGLMFESLEKELNKFKGQKTGEAIMAAINKVMFSPLMLGDAAAVFMGGAPYINHLEKEAKAKFPNDSDKQREWVELKFEERVSRTQQSRDIMDQSDWQTAGSAYQWMVTFMSTPILYGRILSGALRDIRSGVKRGDKKLIKKGLKTGIMFSTIAPIMFQIASTGGELILDSIGYGDDEEEDMLKAWKYNIATIASSFLQHIPILYPLIQNMVDEFAKGSDFDASVSAPISILEKGFDSMKNIIHDVLEDELDWEDESTQKDVNNILRSLGINYKGVKEITGNWIELFETGSVEDWRLLLGYSEYAIE